MRRIVPVLVLCLLIVGCGDKVLVIESDTAWAGTVEQYGGIEGRNSTDIDLSNTNGQVCWSLQKTTTLGTLRAYSRDKTWFGLGTEIDGDMTTRAPNGTVTGCSQ